MFRRVNGNKQIAELAKEDAPKPVCGQVRVAYPESARCMAGACATEIWGLPGDPSSRAG